MRPSTGSSSPTSGTPSPRGMTSAFGWRSTMRWIARRSARQPVWASARRPGSSCRVMDFALQVAPPPYDPQKAKQLLAEAGYPNGLDAGDFVPIPPFFATAEAAVNFLNAVGIRVKMRPVERAAFYAAWQEKKLRGLFMTAVGNAGNAASRVEAFIYSKGSHAYGGYPDIDHLFLQQARERDPRKREALLHKIQQLTIDRAIFAPIMDLRALNGVGPRVADHTINALHMVPWPSWEDMRLQGQ